MGTERRCPDWSNPCKHVAAVCDLIGEEFDREPFLLVALRGLDRAGLGALLGSAGGEAAPPPPEPLPADPRAFWSGAAASPPPPAPEGCSAAVGQTLVRWLGHLPFWRGGRPLAEAVDGASAGAAQRGAALLAGERDPAGPSPHAFPVPRGRSGPRRNRGQVTRPHRPGDGPRGRPASQSPAGEG